MAEAATIWPSPLSTMIDAITVITSGKKPNGLRHSSQNILNTLMDFVHLVSNMIIKVAFIQKVRFVFQISKKNIPNYYPELEIWIYCLLLLPGNLNLNFKFRIVIFHYLLWYLILMQYAHHIILSHHFFWHSSGPVGLLYFTYFVNLDAKKMTNYIKETGQKIEETHHWAVLLEILWIDP